MTDNSMSTGLIILKAEELIHSVIIGIAFGKLAH